MSRLNILLEEYQGKDGQSKLIAQSRQLSNAYKELKKSKDEQKLEDHIEQYDNLIEQFSTKYHEFYSEYLNEESEKKKIVAYAYVGNTQIHLTKLQSQYNQLVYRKQQCDNRNSMKIALWAIGITIFFSLAPSMFSYFNDNSQKKELQDKIEQLYDSINTLSRIIEQQNELILNCSDLLPESTVVPVQEEGKTKEA